MSFPPLAGGDHSILSSEYCSGYTDIAGVWNTGFYCPQTGSTLAVYCCGTRTYKYCCTDKPENGTGAGIVEDVRIIGGVGGVTSSVPTNANGAINIDGGGGDDGNDYSGATRMRPVDDNRDLNMNDLTSLNLSDVPIIFGVACGVAAVLILVILAGFYLTSCCTHYHQRHQSRKRRSSMPGIYRGVTTTNNSTNSGLVNLYSPTNSAGGGGGGSHPGGVLDSNQTYIVHHQQHTHPPASPNSISSSGGDHYQVGGGSASLVTTPLDIEWSSGAGQGQHQYVQQNQGMSQSQHGPVTSSSTSQLLHQQPQQSQHPLNFLDGGGSVGGISNHVESRIHYTVHQTQNRLAVALTGSMNRLSDRPSPCPTPSSSYHVNIPLTPPDGYSYPRHAGYHRGLSPPPQYSSSMFPRSESPPYYPSYDSGSSNNTTDNQLNYLSRTSTLPLSLSRKPPTGANRPFLTSPGPYGYNMVGLTGTPQQPKSILRTSQNYRRVVTNETPPPIPPHMASSVVPYVGPSYPLEGPTCVGGVTYRNVDSRTNLSNQPLLLLESKVDHGTGIKGDGDEDNGDDEDDQGRQSVLGAGVGVGIVGPMRRASITTAINATPTAEEEEEVDDERRDNFDIHDIDSDALSRLIEMDLDSKL